MGTGVGWNFVSGLSGMTGVNGFLVFTHCEVRCCFPDVGFDEVRVEGNGFVAVLYKIVRRRTLCLGIEEYVP